MLTTAFPIILQTYRKRVRRSPDLNIDSVCQKKVLAKVVEKKVT